MLNQCYLSPSSFVCISISGASPGGSAVKNAPANAGDTRDVGLIPGSGRSPGEGNGNPLQYSCQGKPMDRGAWWNIVHGVALTTHAYRNVYVVLCLDAQLYPTLCSPMDCSPPGSSVHGDSPGKNTGVGCHAPGDLPNPGLPHCRQILYHLSHQGSP